MIAPCGSRSAFIEMVLSDHLRELARMGIGERDSAIINANANYFNREMEDVLRFQCDVFDLLEGQTKSQ
jgi:hypothetical protein